MAPREFKPGMEPIPRMARTRDRGVKAKARKGPKKSLKTPLSVQYPNSIA